MTAKLILFPSLKESSIEETPRETITNVLFEYLQEISTDNDFIHYISNRMTEFVLRYASRSYTPVVKMDFPSYLSTQDAESLLAAIDETIQSASNEMNQLLKQIIIERLQFEIDIYRSTAPSFSRIK
ncbi:hypothetical protein [Azotosporobacter soli]|uniref:hypothetical protein n=1 Tax=Azotosporobacter soli TaxID=3055040 RepID=UPI0031FF2AFD